ncbi:MAG: hypothetical protein Q9162_005200 [Coniocarpon cinnabarinum]
MVRRTQVPSAGGPMRTGALSTFLSSYLPDKESCAMGFDQSSFLQALPSRDERNPALRSAIEAVSIAQMGAEHHNEALVREASGLYRTALATLHRSLRQGAADADTLAASMLLQICEFSPGAGNDGYIIHLVGQARMIINMGAANIAKSPYLFQLFMGVRNSEITVGILQRRRIQFGSPEWLQLTSSTALVDPWVSLSDKSAMLPELHEKLDACLANPHDEGLLASTKTLLVSIEHFCIQHERHFARQLSSFGPWIISYRHLRYVQDIPPPETLEEVYRFSNFRMALVYSMFWSLRWNLVQARTKLQAVVVDLPPPPFSPVKTMLECGYEFTRSTAFWPQTRAGSTGRICSLVGLKYASMMFLEEGLMEEAQWCAKLSTHIRENTLCQPRILSIFT